MLADVQNSFTATLRYQVATKLSLKVSSQLKPVKTSASFMSQTGQWRSFCVTMYKVWRRLVTPTTCQRS